MEPAPATPSPPVSAPPPAVAEAEAEPPQMVAEAAPSTSIEDRSETPGPRASAPVNTPSPQSAAIGARLADIRDQRRERREARADLAGGKPQYAKAVPAPVEQAPAYAGPPRVIVLGFGDPAVAGSAEIAIEERLGESGVDVVAEELIGGLGSIEDGSADMARLVANAGRHAEFIVVVRAVPVGEQQLTFYGESMTQYTARMEVATFDVRNRRKLGSGWNTQVSFTHLNADPNTRQAIAPYLSRVVQGLGGRGRG